VGSRRVDGATVSFYDAEPSDEAIDPVIAWSRAEFVRGVTDIFVNPGRIGDGIINSITLYGTGAETADLGIVVEDNNGLLKFVDRRTGTPPLGFLVSEGYVKSVNLKAGIAGADLDGFTTEGGWTLPDDIDGDGSPGDLTGFYSPEYLRSLTARGDLDGDVVAGGDLKALQVMGGDLNGDVVLTASDIGRVTVRALYNRAGAEWLGGSIRGDIRASGNIGSILAVGGDITGDVTSTEGMVRNVTARSVLNRPTKTLRGGAMSGDLTAGAGLTRLFVGSDLSGDVSVTGNLGSVTVRGSILESSIDVTSSVFSPGGWGVLSVLGDVENATFSSDAFLKRVSVRGDFANTSIEAATLGRVLVRGTISEDYADEDEDVIHALEGSFFVRDADEHAWITATEDGNFGGVNAWVG